MNYRFHDSSPDNFWNSTRFDRAKTVFWWAFFLTPFLTGILAYDWLPNESFNEKKHESISSHEVEGPGGQSGTVHDVWADKETGRIYTREQFRNHRENEGRRIAIVTFLYGLVGCLFFGFSRWLTDPAKFFEAFGIAVLINIAWVLFGWFYHAD